MEDSKQRSRKSRVTFGPRKELYDYLKDKDYGFEISYDKLRAILGRDPQGAGRGDVLAVRNWLINDFGKYLEVDISTGYFIAQAAENRDIAARKRAAAFKQVKTGLRILNATDLNQLTADEFTAHVQEQKCHAIEYLVMAQVNKAKKIEPEDITMPTGRELIEIYRRKGIN